MPASPALHLNWNPQSLEAGPQRLHTGMTWPFWKVQYHISTKCKKRGKGVLRRFTISLLCFQNVSAETTTVEQSRISPPPKKEWKWKLEKSAPCSDLSQTDKWFIWFGFASAALLTSTSLSFHFTASDYWELFSQEIHTQVLKTQDLNK